VISLKTENHPVSRALAIDLPTVQEPVRLQGGNPKTSVARQGSGREALASTDIDLSILGRRSHELWDFTRVGF
jgi:hypothetical protein